MGDWGIITSGLHHLLVTSLPQKTGPTRTNPHPLTEPTLLAFTMWVNLLTRGMRLSDLLLSQYIIGEFIAYNEFTYTIRLTNL